MWFWFWITSRLLTSTTTSFARQVHTKKTNSTFVTSCLLFDTFRCVRRWFGCLNLCSSVRRSDVLCQLKVADDIDGAIRWQTPQRTYYAYKTNVQTQYIHHMVPMMMARIKYIYLVTQNSILTDWLYCVLMHIQTQPVQRYYMVIIYNSLCRSHEIDHFTQTSSRSNAT